MPDEHDSFVPIRWVKRRMGDGKAEGTIIPLEIYSGMKVGMTRRRYDNHDIEWYHIQIRYSPAKYI